MLPTMRRQDEELRALEYLGMMVRVTGRSHKEIDETLGWCRGTTSQVLKGRIQLKFRHILEILDVCEVPTAMFLENIYPNIRSAGLQWPEVGDEAAEGILSEYPHAAARNRRPAPVPPPDTQAMLAEIMSRLPAFMALRPQRNPSTPARPETVKPSKAKSPKKVVAKAGAKAAGRPAKRKGSGAS